MITYIILFITVGISIAAMNNESLKNKYMFNAFAISHYREWWRFFTHGVLHADFLHLFFNMIALYFFGPFVESYLKAAFGPGVSSLYFVLLYVGGLVASTIFTFFRQKENKYYNALGASGAISAIIFAAILFCPLNKITFYFFPMPAWLFGIVYLVFSWFMARRNIGNIGHDAHFWGAVYGFVLPVLLRPAFFREFIAVLKLFFFYHQSTTCGEMLP